MRVSMPGATKIRTKHALDTDSRGTEQGQATLSAAERSCDCT